MTDFHVEVSKLDILKYYPYGGKTEWSYWLTGKVDLKKQYEQAYFDRKSETGYVTRIMTEVSRAMHYLTVHRSFDPTDKQTITAFGMWGLFNNGLVGWNKKMTAGKSHDEIVKMEKIQKKRVNMMRHGCASYKDDMHKCETKEYKEAVKIGREDSRKKYGIYEVVYYPLMSDIQLSHEQVPLYTKQQLAAIWTMVMCEFENLC